MTHLNDGGHLPSDLVALVAHVTASLGETSAALIRQAIAATVVRESPTMVDVTVSADVELVELDDGPAPVRALVYQGDTLSGEVLVWVRGGRLIGLEQAWYTDDSPQSWPSPDQVRVA